MLAASHSIAKSVWPIGVIICNDSMKVNALRVRNVISHSTEMISGIDLPMARGGILLETRRTAARDLASCG